MGVRRDPAETVEYFRRAMETGDAEAKEASSGAINKHTNDDLSAFLLESNSSLPLLPCVLGSIMVQINHWGGHLLVRVDLTMDSSGGGG
jgi:TPR repeat protein